MMLVCIISSVSNCGRGNFAIVYRTMHFVVSVKLCLCSALSFFQAYLSVLFFCWDTSQFSISFPNFCCHEDICGRSKPLRFVVLKHSNRSSTDQFISKQLDSFISAAPPIWRELNLNISRWLPCRSLILFFIVMPICFWQWLAWRFAETAACHTDKCLPFFLCSAHLFPSRLSYRGWSNVILFHVCMMPGNIGPIYQEVISHTNHIVFM